MCVTPSSAKHQTVAWPANQESSGPRRIYVDYHSLFFTRDPDALIQLSFTSSVSAMPPRPKSTAKSNGSTKTGRRACPPASPVKKSPKSKSPIPPSTPCDRIAMPRKRSRTVPDHQPPFRAARRPRSPSKIHAALHQSPTVNIPALKTTRQPFNLF